VWVRLRELGTAGIMCVLLAVLVPLASAAEVSREEYKAAVEPICKTNKEASDKYLTGVRKLVKEDKLKEASLRFKKAAAALEKAEKQLATVPRPSADEARLSKWLSDIKGEASLMKTISAKLKSGDKGKASSLSVKLTNNAEKANNLVIGFQFRYCKINPSKYT
jgi:hypothetical protein